VFIYYHLKKKLVYFNDLEHEKARVLSFTSARLLKMIINDQTCKMLYIHVLHTFNIIYISMKPLNDIKVAKSITFTPGLKYNKTYPEIRVYIF